MSDQEIMDLYEELEEHYGENLANFEHHPRQFAHQVKLYLYYKGRINKESDKETS